MRSEEFTESDYILIYYLFIYPKSELVYVTVHTMKAYTRRGRNGTAPLIRGLGARWT